MKPESHKERLLESLKVLEECIEKGVLERQRNIGFNTSAAAVDMLELLLHKHNLIDPGFIVKHDWFNSERKVKEKLNFEFHNKKEILTLMCSIENKRNILCYGKSQKLEIIQEVLKEFNILRNIFKEAGIDEH